MTTRPSQGPTGSFTPSEARQARRLTLVLGVVAVFFVLEFTGAVLARSKVLQADALHLLMDVLALGMSLFAMRLAIRRPTTRFTYGLRRAEPVAAVFNAVLVIGASLEILHDGLGSLGDHEPPRSGLMLVVALAALVVNGVSAWLLHGVMHDGHDHGHGHGDAHGHGHGHGHGHAHEHGHAHDHGHAHEHGHGHGDAHEHDHGHAGGHARDEHREHDGDDHAHRDGPHAQTVAHKPTRAERRESARREKAHQLNLRGAWLHLMGDALGSVAAVVAALVIRFGGPPIIDVVASFLVVAILLAGASRLIRDAILILLEAAPVHVPVDQVREVVLAYPGILEIHDLHVWSLGAGHDAMTVHVRADSPDPRLGARVSDKIRASFGLEYVTVQVELTDEVCDAPSV